MSNKRPLMGTDNILELQDNGYKSTVSALSEIIDNSIQAHANSVDVVIVKNTTRTKDEIDEILVIDDGQGMDENVFEKALQMSSGTRSNAKAGLGKYGQGLPNSSISQTKRVEVYTIQGDKILFNYIDLDEIKNSGEAYLPDTEEVQKIDIPIIKANKVKVPRTGTIVRWVSPNRVKPKTAKTLIEHIEQIAGRIFRYYIVGFVDKDGNSYKTTINLRAFDFNGENYEQNDFLSKKSIKPFDPMFLMRNTQMDDEFPECSHPTSVLYDEPIKKKFKVDYQGEIVETEVEIKLSYVKREERKRFGRNAGNEPFGKKYLHRNMKGTSGYNNISIVRAGREIDSGSFGFIGDVSDNRERWWSAEIIVEPIIDSIIGVDNKKQYASEIKFIEGEEFNEDDIHEIIKWISIWLDENKGSVKKIITEQMAASKTPNKPGNPGLPGGGDSEPGDPADEDEFDEDEKNRIRNEFFDWVKERYPELKDKEIWEKVDYALSVRDNHIFIKSDLGDTKLYSYTPFGTKVLIEINYSHSFYSRFMQHFELDTSQEKSLRSIRLMIGAMVNAEIVTKTKDHSILQDRKKVRNRMFESLDDYIEDLYSS